MTTSKFHNIMEDMNYILYLPSGRINFESGLGKKGKSPAFGSIIIKLSDKTEIKHIKISELRERRTKRKEQITCME